MEDTEDDIRSITPQRAPLPCDAVDQPTSPVKPEVDKRSPPPREFVVKSPETAADASPHAHNDGVTCDAPASPIGAVSAAEQEREQALTPPTCIGGSPYRFIESQNDTKTSLSYFGESHVNRLQSFVDSVAAASDDVTSSWSRGRISSEPGLLCRPAVPPRTCSQLRQPVPHQPTAVTVSDEPLDLSLKPPSLRRPDPAGELPFPVPVVAPSLFPLLCRESWIAQWAALAAASLQHSLLFPVTSQTATVDNTTCAQAAWMTSSSPRSSSSSSSPSGGSKMADERRRRTALTAMESFVEGSFKRHKPPLPVPTTSGYELAHVNTNRKRRRHVAPPEITSSGDEDGGGSRKREKTGTGSVSPRSDDVTSHDDVTDKQSSVTSPEINGEVELVGYLSCDGQDATTKEHPLVSLEKFVGVSAPLFPLSTTPPSALTLNGLSCRPPAAGKTSSEMASYGGDCAGPEVVTSRSMRGDVDSGSLGRGYTSAQSLLCCNL